MLSPLVGTMFLASVATAQTVYIDTGFDDWYAPQIEPWGWIVNPVTGPDQDWEVREVDPDGVTQNKSLWTRGYYFRTFEAGNYPMEDLQIIPTNAEPVVFSFRFYDMMDREEGVTSQTRNFVEIGQVAEPLRLYAFGVWDGSNTHYRIRNYPGTDWETLDVERTVGWHEVKWVFNADTFDLYFDGELIIASRAYSPIGLGFDRVTLGSGYVNSVESFLYDDLYLAKDPAYAPSIFLTRQPTEGLPSPMPKVDFGEAHSFSVEVEGGVPPYTYEWFHNDEKIENSDRISGADTDTLTIESAESSDSGSYYVEVRDSAQAIVRSATARLLALAEHEVIIAGGELPASAITGTWTNPVGGWHGGDRYASMTDDPEAERTITYQPELTKSGWYEVSTYFIPSYSGEGNNRTTEAPFFVHNLNGEDLVLVNQQNLLGPAGATWVTVGTFEFAEGTDGKVVISNVYQQEETPTRYGTLIFAGALRFTPTEAPGVDGDGPSVSIARTEAGDIELLIEGEPEVTYTIQAVDNLGDEWADLGTETTDPEGSAVFTDSAAGEAPRRFYRVVIE